MPDPVDESDNDKVCRFCGATAEWIEFYDQTVSVGTATRQITRGRRYWCSRCAPKGIQMASTGYQPSPYHTR